MDHSVVSINVEYRQLVCAVSSRSTASKNYVNAASHSLLMVLQKMAVCCKYLSHGNMIQFPNVCLEIETRSFFAKSGFLIWRA